MSYRVTMIINDLSEAESEEFFEDIKTTIIENLIDVDLEVKNIIISIEDNNKEDE